MAKSDFKALDKQHTCTFILLSYNFKWVLQLFFHPFNFIISISNISSIYVYQQLLDLALYQDWLSPSCGVRPCLFPIIISLSVEISDNPTKCLAYFSLCGNPLQIFELREARIEKRENLRFSQPRSDYKLSKNKQDLRRFQKINNRISSHRHPPKGMGSLPQKTHI